ncbi:MAG: YciI family protein [Devosia sp.]
MRYMMIIHHDDAAMAKTDQKALWADYAAFNEALGKAAGASSGERLEPPNGATIVRGSDILDGPYSDSKEQLAGYFFVDVPNVEEAVAWAQRCPSSRFGSIEIRPLFVPKGDWKQ